MSKVDLDRQITQLRAKRRALLDQVDALDVALAALTSRDITVANTRKREPRAAAEEAASPVVPTRVEPRRVLSDQHRHASMEGRRKARHSREAAAGRAREALDPSPGLAPTASRLPQLVKRNKHA